MFSCDLDGSDLPKHDDGKDNYQCGSIGFNIQYYTWLSLTLLFIGFVAIIRQWKDKIENYIGIGYTVGCVREWLSYTNPESFPKTPLINAGRFFSVILHLAIYSTIFIVGILFPMYCILGVYYGTYTHAYAFSVSAAFLSGIVPFGLEFSFWMCFLVFFCFYSCCC